MLKLFIGAKIRSFSTNHDSSFIILHSHVNYISNYARVLDIFYNQSRIGYAYDWKGQKWIR